MREFHKHFLLVGAVLVICLLLNLWYSHSILNAWPSSLEEVVPLFFTAFFTAVTSLLFTSQRCYFGIFGPVMAFAVSVLDIAKYSVIFQASDVFTSVGFLAGILNVPLILSGLIPFRIIRQVVLFLLILLFCVPFIALWGYYGISGAWPHPDTILAILQTNPGEALTYLKVNMSLPVLCLPLVIILCIFGLSWIPLEVIYRTVYRREFAIAAVFLCLCNGALAFQCRSNPLVRFVGASRDYIARYDDFARNKAAREARIGQNIQVMDKDAKGVYVLVIGESQNRLHMSAYGYSRDTTPWLESEKKDPNFLLFTNAYSCHTQTVPVLSYALTEKNQYNSIDLEDAVSLIEAANAAGFDTAWVSNQVRYGAWDTPTSVIASEAHQQIWLNDHSGETTSTDYYDGKLADSLKQLKMSDKMLIVIHLMGDHADYTDRYPEDFEYYHSDDNNENLDSYDDSIRYNDYVMSRIFDEVKKIPDFQGLVYFSDHSEGVDEGKQHDVTNFTNSMTYIPMYMYFSKDYIEHHQDIWKNLKKHQDTWYTNDLIFNTMMSIMQMQMQGFNEPENDFTGDRYDGERGRFRTLHGEKPIIAP